MTTFSDEIAKIRNEKTHSDGGYLLPQEMRVEKVGIRAAIWRVAGRLFKRADWVELGMEYVNTYYWLMDIKKD